MFEYQRLIHETIDGQGPWYYFDNDPRDFTWGVVSRDWQKVFGPLIRTFVKNRGVVVQAGGWQGLYPRLLSEMFDLVYTFEPDPQNFLYLSLNCQKSNIIKMQAALSSVCGSGIFQTSLTTGQGRMTHYATNLLDYPTRSEMTVQQITLDSLNLTCCDFLMIDVENYELEVFNGAISTIKSCRPIILTETNASNKITEDTVNLIKSLGYRLHLNIHEERNLLFLPEEIMHEYE